ncbi:hypothetical protein A1O3_09112 [Capronia epimyces CBS 606.96]|uniref:Uncharacterized protein n=1 Tax=Capronia epimyces CBS 606.96 TaxID=1182542 RepID=W9XCN3_9EURO|nr:uncharacterized protein A1O3_09112 [Capronia epimyces CBS 606.96]EXJ77953.1 hypothetical protein A1O3_09112 [Capronia epimyces CBS 606.96]
MLSVTNPDPDPIQDYSETPIPEDNTLLSQPWPPGEGEVESEPETLEQTAFRLTWLASWKLQREYELIEPDLPKVIGHVSVWTNASHCVNTVDESAAAATAEQTPSLEIAEPEEDTDTVLPESESESLLEKTQVQEQLFNPYAYPEDEAVPKPSARTPSSVVVTEIKLDDREHAIDPFSDEEEESNYDSDDEDEDKDKDTDWSSDGETYCGSHCGEEDDKPDQEHEQEEEQEQDIADCSQSAAPRLARNEKEMWERYTNLGPAPESQPQVLCW